MMQKRHVDRQSYETVYLLIESRNIVIKTFKTANNKPFYHSAIPFCKSLGLFLCGLFGYSRRETASKSLQPLIPEFIEHNLLNEWVLFSLSFQWQIGCK